jgi:hypothetical protein
MSKQGSVYYLATALTRIVRVPRDNSMSQQGSVTPVQQRKLGYYEFRGITACRSIHCEGNHSIKTAPCCLLYVFSTTNNTLYIFATNNTAEKYVISFDTDVYLKNVSTRMLHNIVFFVFYKDSWYGETMRQFRVILYEGRHYKSS